MTKSSIGLIVMVAGLAVATGAALWKTHDEVVSTQTDLGNLRRDAYPSSTSCVQADWPAGLVGLSVKDTSSRIEDPEAFRSRVKADFSFYLDQFPPERRP